MANMVELNRYGLWAGKQSAKGTPNGSPGKRLIQIGGDFDAARSDSVEAYSDLSKYGQEVDWINDTSGQGAPVLEATPEELAYLLWLHHGGETVTSGVAEVQTLTITATGGTYTLTYTDASGSQTTTALSFSANAAAIQAALQALTNIGAGNVTVAGTGPFTITFAGTLASKPVQLITPGTGSLTGGSATVTRTTAGAKGKHTFVPLAGLGFWSTWFKRLGVSSIQREQYNDCQISQSVIEGSTATKAVHITPTVLSLDPANWFTSDPSQAVPTKSPFLYTDGTGTFTIDGQVRSGHSQFALTLAEGYQAVYSDDTTAYDFIIAAQPSVTLALTMYFDQDGLAWFNNLVYGSSAPSAGQKPLKRLPALGSYSFDLKAKDSSGNLNGDEFKLTVANVKWALPPSPGPNPAGGTPQISLAGAMRAPTSPPYQIDISCDAAAFTT